MITVPEIVVELVKQKPFLEEGLSQGIINLSSLARQLKPQIQKRLLKNIQEGAIVMALKRLEEKLHADLITPIPLISLTDITVRSNLVEFTFQNSPTLMERQEQLLKLASSGKNSFLTFTYGLFETTLISNSTLKESIEKIFAKEIVKSNFTQLSAITLILPAETITQPGIYYQILKKLAWEGINVIEVVSSATELTIILEKTSVEKAFAVLNEV